jgi:hypothetical protein
MEHPLQVEEFLPGSTRPRIEAEPAPKDVPAARVRAPLPQLPNLPPSDVLFLRPSDPEYAAYLPASNRRTELSPSLRSVCKTERAVSATVEWARANSLSFAIRSGGHSYEGFSQSEDVVIDVRELNTIVVDKSAGVVSVGSGASLLSIYRALAAEGLAIPAGSCPTVGVSGHLMGGGFGLLGRAYGLTCDHLRRLTLIDAEARALPASATSDPDLFWACRGGGGGSFGVATQFIIGTVPVTKVAVFGVSWTLSQTRAARVFEAWQNWAPTAPKNITSIIKIGPRGKRPHCAAVHWTVGRYRSRGAQSASGARSARTALNAAEGRYASLFGRCPAFRRFPRLPIDILQSQVGLRNDRAQRESGRRVNVRGCGRSPGRVGLALRRIRRRGLRSRRCGHRISTPRRTLLHTVLLKLGARGRHSA